MAARFQNVIMCDQVYFDRATNKAVLAGVYTGDVTCQGFPIIFRFAVYAELLADSDGDTSVEVEIYIDEKRTVRAKVGFSDLKAGEVSVLAMPNLEVRTDKPARIRVKAILNGKGRTVIDKRLIPAPPT